jgi:hypothetical protein
MPTVVELNTSSNPAFATIPDGAGLPDQTGHSGEYLTTDGVTASWGVVDLSSYLPLAGGTLTGNLSFSTGFKLIRHLAAAANVAGSVLSVLGSFGGDTATGDAAGNGGTVVLTAGYGGAAGVGAGAAGVGGTLQLAGGNGGAGTDTGAAGVGGTVNMLGGAGGAGTASTAAGAGGDLFISGGTGGTDNGGGVGAGGNIYIDAGSDSLGAPSGAVNIGINSATASVAIGSSIGLLGLYGASPVAQPSSTGQTSGFTAGAGTAVLDDSTFTGGSGTKAYTVGDLVRHLKALGAIATS